MSNGTKSGFKVFINFLAFIALVFVGVSLILTKLIGVNDVTNALELIAQIIAYSMVAFYALIFAKSKRNWIFILLWVVSVTLIIVSFFLA